MKAIDSYPRLSPGDDSVIQCARTIAMLVTYADQGVETAIKEYPELKASAT